MYKDNWTQPWHMGSEIYHEVHGNPRAFFNSSSSILLEPLAHGSSDWSLPREDCIIGCLGNTLFWGNAWSLVNLEARLCLLKQLCINLEAILILWSNLIWFFFDIIKIMYSYIHNSWFLDMNFLFFLANNQLYKFNIKY